MKKIFSILFCGLLFWSCSSDDDICIGGEATPRMIVKFKTQSTGNIRSMDSIFVNVNYGNGWVAVIENSNVTDSLIIPLRVDESPFTEITVSTDSIDAPNPSKFTVNYTTESQYVSPACGVKRIYKNVSYDLVTPNPVLSVQSNQSEIIDENKTHLYLLF